MVSTYNTNQYVYGVAIRAVIMHPQLGQNLVTVHGILYSHAATNNYSIIYLALNCNNIGMDQSETFLSFSLRKCFPRILFTYLYTYSQSSKDASCCI